MPEKPRILKAVSEMIAQGLSDDDIVENLKAVGLSDDQIRKVMEVSRRDVYARFKREMTTFFDQRLKSNSMLIDKMVDGSLAKKKSTMRNEFRDEVQEMVGDLAKEVNTKSRDMEMSVKKIREENVHMKRTEQLNRTDIDVLMAGSSKYRMMISVIFLSIGVIVMLVDGLYLVPKVGEYIIDGYLQQAALYAILVFSFVAFSIAALAVGVYFSGRPGRQ